jgi:hypothetical protein
MNATIRKNSDWKEYEKILFRFFFIYFFLQVFPLDWKYYKHLININWLNLDLSDIFNLSKYTPQFVSHSYNPDNWGLATFADWGFISLIAIVGTLIWTSLDRKRSNYQQLYNWLRILVRYRLSLALLTYGFLKVFAIQAPFPSLANLNTPYGDFSDWKIFSLTLGIVPDYQAFLGVVEVLAGILLLHRKTTVMGATIVIFFTGNVFMSNLAYDGAEVVYSFYLVTLALFLIVYDLERLVNLLILHKPTFPANYTLSLSREQNLNRIVLKSIFILLFVVFNAYSTYQVAAKGGYHYSYQPGVKALHGFYHVRDFSYGGETIPPEANDSIRWQNVVFEKWASLSIKVHNPYTFANRAAEDIPKNPSDGKLERQGIAGRRYFSYTADTTQHVLLVAEGNNKSKLSYKIEADSTVLLQGIIGGREIRAVLEKDEKKYLLKESSSGRRRSLKL